ncbi:4-hydroxyphenylacetate decarboxylase small subunit [Succinispira mobilis]|uniref:4-hydroxyphenylacetate decarboxylase small subunit n=1 Tax=Succinispira mobilis TaxID=78120 RepID=UPI00035D1AD4|nr:4-hydroxyphenylacetate decarboxylase small subunit [Succinispira mobilis]
MMNEKYNHLDCVNFTPIDVAKGFCNAHHAQIMLIDSDTCPMFEAKQKCKFCSNLADIDEKGMGTCQGYAKKDWAYAEMAAPFCEKFSKK